jgi:hypothetical protein
MAGKSVHKSKKQAIELQEISVYHESTSFKDMFFVQRGDDHEWVHHPG